MTRSRKRNTATAEVNGGVHIPRFEIVDIADVHPYEYNPRNNEKAVQALANSIRQFGFNVPIVIDADGGLAAGHTRYLAAVQLGMTSLPALRAEHLSEEQIRQFRIIDNKVAELAEWDMDLLAPEISALQASGINFTEFGFSQEEIDCLTDIVTDDCLSATGVRGQETSPSHAAENRRAPAQARFVLSEFVFFVPQAAYRRWASEMRATHDYNEAEILNDLKERLGLTPYINAESE